MTKTETEKKAEQPDTIARKLTPHQIVKELDKYVIGQDDAKKIVAVALRNRYRRLYAPEDIRSEIMPANILMIGTTGIGKTEIARRLAKIADAPFIKVEASKFTEVGYVGRDVESMVRDLVEQCYSMVKTQELEEVKTIAAERVEDIILDILIPPVKPITQTPKIDLQSNSQGEKTIMVTVTENASDEKQKENGQAMEDLELNKRTREKFRIKIRNGEMDERKIEIQIQQSVSTGIGVVAPPGIDDMTMMNIQEMIGGMLPKKNKTRLVSIAEAKKILLEEEAAKLIDYDAVKAEAIKKTENSGIIFIDEIDKIANAQGKGGGIDVSREGVQRDLLPIVEGSTVNTKYGAVSTDHILFIAAGAFHVSKPSDLIPELQGRFPIRAELTSLSRSDFYKILKTPKNALTKQYEGLFKSENVAIEFTDEALKLISKLAFEVNEKLENIGARRLSTLMSQLLNEYLFDVPEKIPAESKLVIDEKLVQEKLSELVKDQDLSNYIL